MVACEYRSAMCRFNTYSPLIHELCSPCFQYSSRPQPLTYHVAPSLPIIRTATRRTIKRFPKCYILHVNVFSSQIGRQWLAPRTGTEPLNNSFLLTMILVELGILIVLGVGCLLYFMRQRKANSAKRPAKKPSLGQTEKTKPPLDTTHESVTRTDRDAATRPLPPMRPSRTEVQEAMLPTLIEIHRELLRALHQHSESEASGTPSARSDGQTERMEALSTIAERLGAIEQRGWPSELAAPEDDADPESHNLFNHARGHQEEVQRLKTVIARQQEVIQSLHRRIGESVEDSDLVMELRLQLNKLKENCNDLAKSLSLMEDENKRLYERLKRQPRRS